jgi:hypothetical protein
MVYGPEDEIVPVVIHWGAPIAIAAGAELTVEVIDAEGEMVDSKTYTNLELPEGRDKVVLEGWRPDFGGEGLYTIVYELQLNGATTRR